MSYLRPTKTVNLSHIVKKSQFIATLGIVYSKQDAMLLIKKIADEHPRANHNCYCFISAAPTDLSSWGYSDDGEPKGTAGLPMFQVLKHSNIGNICIVVTRYFGGIKLGTGGIARAYSLSVSMLLNQITTEEIHPRTTCSLFVPFHLTGIIEYQFNRYKTINIENRTWTETGQQIVFSIEDSFLHDFKLEILPYQNEVSTLILRQ